MTDKNNNLEPSEKNRIAQIEKEKAIIAERE